MKTLSRLIFLISLCLTLTSCLFREPVFTSGFVKVDPDLGGVWILEENKDDPRKNEYVVCAPLDEDRLVLNYPANESDAIYYEARMVKVRERSLLQLRILATFKDGLPKADAERYTILWIEKGSPATSGPTFRVRAIDGDRVKNKSSMEVKQLLEDSTTDWEPLFGEQATFRRLKGN